MLKKTALFLRVGFPKGVGEYVEDRGPKSDPIEQEREVSSACSWRDEAMMKEEMKEKKMRTMYFHNLEMKEYVKKGTLYEARKTWEVRSHMLDLAAISQATKSVSSQTGSVKRETNK